MRKSERVVWRVYALERRRGIGGVGGIVIADKHGIGIK